MSELLNYRTGSTVAILPTVVARIICHLSRKSLDYLPIKEGL